MTDAALSLDDVTVHAGGQAIIRDVSITVPSGTVTTVVGPSGAGKTTLLRAVAGLADVHTGRIAVGGRDVTTASPADRDVAFVFQEPRLFPNLDVAENVAFSLRVAGRTRADRRRVAEELLDRVGLAGFGQRRVRQLSGGEQQRVNLARALAAQPQVMLLDEPLAAVDPSRRAELRELLRHIHEGFETTAVHVTHDLDEAAELGDRIAVVLDGRVVQHTPVKDLFTAPLNPVVAALTGNPNILHGHVERGRLVVAEGALDVGGNDGPATVTIRPEHLRVGVTTGLTFRVTDVRYRGSHTAIRLAGTSTSLLCVTSATTLPDVGDTVVVGADPSDIHRYAEPWVGTALSRATSPLDSV